MTMQIQSVDNFSTSVQSESSESYNPVSAVAATSKDVDEESLSQAQQLFAESLEEDSSDILLQGIVDGYIHNRKLHHKIFEEANDENRQF